MSLPGNLDNLSKPPPTYKIETVNADKTIFGTGGKSKTTQRIKFFDDPSFAFNVMTTALNVFQEIHARCWYTKVKGDDGKELWINTKSLAHRLLLTPEEIKAQASSEKGITLEWISIRVKAVKEAVAKAKIDSQGLETQYEPEKAQSHLDLDTVKYLSRHAWTIAHLDPDNKITKHGIKILFKGETYLAKLDLTQKKMFIISLKDQKKLGAGASGTAYRVFDITSGAFKVLKQYYAREKYEQIIRTLDEANPDNTIKGIVPKPEVTMARGYITDEFIPLNTFLKDKSPQEKLLVCRNLTEAFYDLKAKAELRHADIKPDNIFVEKTKDGKFQVRIGDLDFARKFTLENILDIDFRWTTAHFFFQPSYISHNDLQAYIKAINEKNVEKYKIASEHHDMFSLGITFFSILTDGKSAFTDRQLIEGFVSSGKFNEEALKNRNVDPKAIQLLKEMLDLDPSKRPSLEDFKKRSAECFPA